MVTVRGRMGTIACLLLVYCPRAFSLDPSLDISQYAHTAWTIRSGFPGGGVNAITQTADGYLWVGAQNGLYRFDGVRLTPLHERPVSNEGVGALLPARDGTLWIGITDGLVSWKGGLLRQAPVIGRSRITALLEDREGTVWVGTTLGGFPGRLCAIRGEATICYGADGSFGSSVASLYEDSEHTLWVGAASGLTRWKTGAPTSVLSVPILERQAFAAGDRPTDLVLISNGSLHQLLDGTAYQAVNGLPSALNATRILRDRNGGLWIGTATHGLMRSYGGRVSTFTQKDGLSSDQVKGLFEDREGTIWVGTAAGFDLFRECAITSLSVDEGLSNSKVSSVLAAQDGSLWVGTFEGLDRWKDGQLIDYRRQTHPDLPDGQIESLFEDEHGRLWVAGYHELAIFKNEHFTAVPSVPWGSKFAMADDHRGGLWLSIWFTAHDDGLLHLMDGKIIDHLPWQTLGAGLLTDPDGGVWVGLRSGGLAYFHDGRELKLPLLGPDGANSAVLGLTRSSDGALWVGTQDGLSRIANGRAATLSTANGLPCNSVFWMIEDSVSSYWLYTQCGLLRIAREQLDAWVADPKRAIQVTTFDDADGVRLVPILSGFHPQVTKSSDGRIWFINYDTLSYFDPSRMKTNSVVPAVHIEEITADRKTYDPRPGLRLPALVRDVTIRYTALSLAAPERMHFKYKLDGQDPGWREIINDRDRQAHYSNLAPARYRFRVIASNNSGVWNEQGASLQFSIDAAYWQTGWFRALCGAAFLGLILLLYWLRVRQLAQQFNMKLEARVDERTRIARDLHDTMLQNFQGVLLQFQAARRFLSREPDKAEELLASAIDQAGQAIKGGREAVQGLRASTLESNDLAAAIASVGREVATGQGSDVVPAIRVEVEGVAQDLHPIIRDEILHVATEALRNAVQHSHGTEVEVELRYTAREFRLRVRDNGQGIDQKILAAGGREGHFGLRGMRERVALFGGKMTVWSNPGAGTEVEILLRGSKAYRSARS